MGEMPALRIGGEIEEELAVSRPLENVGNTLAREDAFFLLPERFERLPYVAHIGCGREANFAVFRHVPPFGAIAPTRRRRALRPIERRPIVAQPRDVCAIGVGSDAKISERIGLG